MEPMGKHRCDPQKAIDELITNLRVLPTPQRGTITGKEFTNILKSKLDLWDALKEKNYNLGDGSIFNPRSGDTDGPA